LATFLEHRLRGVQAGLLEAGQRGDGVDAGQLLMTNSMSLTGAR
jgi:hypothetical protein